MPENCDGCGEEKGYDDVTCIECDLKHEHVYCTDCIGKKLKEALKK